MQHLRLIDDTIVFKNAVHRQLNNLTYALLTNALSVHVKQYLCNISNKISLTCHSSQFKNLTTTLYIY